jgi:hypothetical protein
MHFSFNAWLQHISARSSPIAANRRKKTPGAERRGTHQLCSRKPGWCCSASPHHSRLHPFAPTSACMHAMRKSLCGATACRDTKIQAGVQISQILQPGVWYSRVRIQLLHPESHLNHVRGVGPSQSQSSPTRRYKREFDLLSLCEAGAGRFCRHGFGQKPLECHPVERHPKTFSMASHGVPTPLEQRG